MSSMTTNVLWTLGSLIGLVAAANVHDLEEVAIALQLAAERVADNAQQRKIVIEIQRFLDYTSQSQQHDQGDSRREDTHASVIE